MNITKAGIASVILSCGVSNIALAQEATQAPQASEAVAGDIIVTAQRRSQSLLDVPLAISALGGDALESKGITNSASLATAVPNLQVSSSFGRTQPNFSLRGISVANEFNSNQASPVGVYIDDVYIAARTVRVNAVSAGPTMTETVKALMETDKTGAVAAVTSALPLGRLAKPEEIAEVFLFLASARSSVITGQVIHANCGGHMA